MLYVEYHEISGKYHAAQKKLDRLLDEKQELFDMTQPKAVDYGKERTSGGTGDSVFDIYLIKKEQSRIDERIEEQKQILEERRQLKNAKAAELRSSREWQDKIYCYTYIDRLSLSEIETRIPYSRVQIWRILTTIKRNLEAVN